MSRDTVQGRGRDSVRGDTSAAQAEGLLPERVALGGRGQASGRLADRGAAAAEEKAHQARKLAGCHADLIKRVANNAATRADRELFDKMLNQNNEFHRGVVQCERVYREIGEEPKADRIRAHLARVLLERRSRSFGSPAQKQDTSERGGRPERDEITESEAAEAQEMTEMVERVLYGTASKAHKKLFTHQLMASEPLFERILELKKVFELRNSKDAQDKAKRLGRLLNDCNEMLLEMHKDAAAANELNLTGETLGSSPPGRDVSGASASTSSPSRGSAAGGSGQFKRGPSREGAPAARDPRAFNSAFREHTPSQTRAVAAAAAAAAAQRISAGVTNTLGQMTLEEQQPGVQADERSGGSGARSRAAPLTNRKKAGKGRSKK
jgi:hypothetical protein